MANLNEFIHSMGGLVLVGTIIVVGAGVTTYFGYSVKKNLTEPGYNPTLFNTTDRLDEGYATRRYGGTKHKKNKSRKNK
jgi:hypothetical protein